MRKTRFITAIALAGSLFQTAQAVEKENWISAGMVSNGAGTINLLEYETLVSDDVSIGIRLASGSYTYTSGSYKENGDDTGVEATIRYYPGAVGFRGLYYGAGFGFWTTRYTWTDPYDIPTSGSGSKSNVNLNASLGWKLRFNRGTFFLDPQVFAGLHTSFGFYAGAGIQVGMRF